MGQRDNTFGRFAQSISPDSTHQLYLWYQDIYLGMTHKSAEPLLDENEPKT